jgi:hypothetical protein
MRPRLTIARWMGLTAILAVDFALVRAFVVQQMFCGGILIFSALQAGLWCLVHGKGRPRRFWLGFEVSGIAAVLALFSCELLPGSPPARLATSYTDIAARLAFTLSPPPLADRLDEHWELYLAVVYFVPELVAALLGGMIAARLYGKRRTLARTSSGRNQPSSSAGFTPR